MGRHKRPALRYHGGKWKIGQWVISNFPKHRIYVEPYGGGASVLLQKERSYSEVYNDIDEEIVHFFQVLRDQGPELRTLLANTPFARTEFNNAYLPGKMGVERARATVIKSFMGFGSDSISRQSGFRGNANRSGTTPAHDWAHYPDAMEFMIQRLQGVVIENRDALKVMQNHDAIDALHYVDPPYIQSTRSERHAYRHEMDDDQHHVLAEFLKTLKGKVVLSGYDSAIYKKLYKGWRVARKHTSVFQATPRTEVLWMNFKKA